MTILKFGIVEDDGSDGRRRLADTLAQIDYAAHVTTASAATVRSKMQLLAASPSTALDASEVAIFKSVLGPSATLQGASAPVVTLSAVKEESCTVSSTTINVTVCTKGAQLSPVRQP